MESLGESIRAVSDRRRTIRVYAADPDPAVAAGFATRNVAVETVRVPDVGEGFVVVEDEDGFVGAMGLDTFEAFLEPPIGRPGAGGTASRARYRDLLAVLSETAFASLDRRQLLATSREIEDRAWRVGEGRLVAGFQRPEALRAQTDVYRHLAADRDLGVTLYVPSGWAPPDMPGVAVVTADAAELGVVWFVAFDGGGDGQECALVAEERDPGEFFGYWTYDAEWVADLFAYLDRTY